MLNNILEIIKRHMMTEDHLPIFFDRKKSKGSYLYDQKTGKKYMDVFSQFASQPIGYNHEGLHEPDFKEEILSWCLHKIVNSDLLSEPLGKFVSAFENFGMPEGLPYLFLIDGGALAVENALKASFDWKIRKNIKKGIIGIPENEYVVAHLRNAFHGRSGYTLSITNTDPNKTMYFPKFLNWPRFDAPKINSPGYREEECLQRYHNYLAQNPHRVVAFIFETIQGEGGDFHCPISFIQKIIKINREHDILSVDDEVQAGVGLTGKFWAYEHYDVIPDIIIFGKKMQICGCLANREKFDEVDDHVFVRPGRINSTWGGNIVDMVRITQLLKIIKQENLISNAEIQGNYLLEKLRNNFQKENIIQNARGRGLMIAFDLPTPQRRNETIAKLFEKQVLILPCGTHSIRLRPMLDINREDIDKFLEILEDVLKK